MLISMVPSNVQGRRAFSENASLWQHSEDMAQSRWSLFSPRHAMRCGSFSILLFLVLGFCGAAEPQRPIINGDVPLFQPDPRMSEPCLTHVAVFYQEAMKRTSWAVNMLDASAKLPSGVLRGNLAWLGSFTECLQVRADRNKTKNDWAFRGEYCRVKIEFDGPDLGNSTVLQIVLHTLAASSVDETSNLEVGVCVPSSCSSADVYFGVDQGLEETGILGNVTVLSCGEESGGNIDWVTIVVTCVWCIFLVLLIVGTLLDVTRNYWSPWLCCPCPTMNGGSSTDALAAPEDTNQRQEPSALNTFLIAFSVYSNAKVILNLKQADGTLYCLHGIRFLSMTWVVLGHTYFVGTLSPQLWENTSDFSAVPSAIAFQTVMKGTFSVDTFFFISGLLASYIFIRGVKQHGRTISIGEFYLHRLWRLTPLYGMVIALAAGLMARFASGPLWNSIIQMQDDCRNYWWKNLLYINNFGETSHMCIPHSWYLSVDTQFYAISPLILYPSIHHPKLAMTIGGILTSASCITAGIITYVLNLPTSSLENLPAEKLIAYSVEFYIKPYCRLGPYMVGMAVGYILIQEIKLNLTPGRILLGWILTLGCNAALIFGTYNQLDTEPTIKAALYNGLSSTAWSCCIGWLCITCVFGYGGFVNSILSWGFWIPLSRLTYSAYLLHYLIQCMFYNSRESKLHFDHVFMVLLFLGFLVVSYCLAFLFSVAFEVPMTKLSRAKLLRTREPSPEAERVNEGHIQEQPVYGTIQHPNVQQR